MDLHIHIHDSDETRRLLHQILEQGELMAADLTRLRADVARNTDLLKSAETTISGIAQALRDAQNSPDPQAAIDELATQLETDDAGLAAAIAENTPGAPQPTT